MYGKATLDVPWSGNNQRIFAGGLSDEMAMQYGRMFARTLSEQDGFITVTLSSGSVRVIGHRTLTDKLTIGRLHPNYRTHQEREV